MTNRHKPQRRFEVVRRYRPNCPIPIHEGVPDGNLFPAKGDLSPEEDSEIISEIPWASIIKVEEYGFTSLIDTRIEAVAVSMTICPGQIIGRLDRRCCALGDVLKINENLRILHNSAVTYSRERPMQQMFEIKSI